MSPKIESKRAPLFFHDKFCKLVTLLLDSCFISFLISVIFILTKYNSPKIQLGQTIVWKRNSLPKNIRSH